MRGRCGGREVPPRGTQTPHKCIFLKRKERKTASPAPPRLCARRRSGSVGLRGSAAETFFTVIDGEMRELQSGYPLPILSKGLPASRRRSLFVCVPLAFLISIPRRKWERLNETTLSFQLAAARWPKTRQPKNVAALHTQRLYTPRCVPSPPPPRLQAVQFLND